MIYFDYAATTPMGEEALSVYTKASREFFGNSSSLHDEGGRAHVLLEQCREALARFIGGKQEGIYFTSGGTESNLLGIVSLARAAKKKGKHIITSMAEHTSVHSAMMYLEKEGFQITKLPLSSRGVVETETLAAAIRPDTVLVSLQYANQEIGAVNPLEEIGALLKKKGILFHSDCVQALGKLDIRPLLKWADSLSVSSHKIFGPKGVGAVHINPSIPWTPLFPGLTHEKGFRGGTVDVPAIAAFTAAAEKVCHSFTLEREWALRWQLKEKLKESLYEWIEADSSCQLPSIIGMKRAGMEGQLVMLKLNEQGFAISTGSACDSRSETGTKAVLAIGYSMEEARQFFRISFSGSTTSKEIERLGNVLLEISSAVPC
ncbi:aminotransferase class V-fold PLP-dependent enzyme [Bacillus aerolatus]|uniref:Aminotransferase class V-fold PLP-dependent enzyme n=1 Tax=Bacillus aerolatus TaxID=2653354 RepID=A0A6I1FPM2_9BACI|nr:IscS subfamily cysteine desulfurase [Bacillus aerolatus]KAB7708634.1 aminotransferase class V-fold PLP-dependent enzyme [Bacillus aerolatus]